MNLPEQIRQLLEKYQDQGCNEEELQQLHDWMEQQALSGKEWTFRNDSDRSVTRENIHKPVIAAMGGQNEVREIQLVEKIVQETKIRGKWKMMPWIKYTAIAASVLGCVWGLSRVTGTPKELIAKAVQGKIEKLVLPDGSTVWLNDNTELAYYDNFEKNRTVELRKGEAFFDIKRDASHPFIVKANTLSTTVLGTSFSVKMIGAAKEIKISVVTGKVMVSQQKDTLGTLLPSQRLKYSARQNGAVVDSVLTGEANGWINGDLFLENASLGEVIQWLQDHYKINVRTYRRYYEGQYYLHVKSDIGLQEMLSILNLLGEKNHVQFSLQENTITIR
ncbi:FecR family protein [Flavitalea flava]